MRESKNNAKYGPLLQKLLPKVPAHCLRNLDFQFNATGGGTGLATFARGSIKILSAGGEQAVSSYEIFYSMIHSLNKTAVRYFLLAFCLVSRCVRCCSIQATKRFNSLRTSLPVKRKLSKTCRIGRIFQGD